MISKIQQGFQTLLIQLKEMVMHTFDFKGKTTLQQSAYALVFQFLIIMLTLIFFLGQLVIIVPRNLFLSFLIYAILSFPSTLSLMTRRLRDSETNPYTLLYLPLSYVLLIVVGFTMLVGEYMSMGIMLMLVIFFLSHFDLIVLLLLPSQNNTPA
jgi:uncharacterized membrane protein YhaH (DUF805 family)